MFNFRRSNSCVGIAGEVTNSTLDEETLQEVSVSNRMVKAMFESSAPKYKFGGSGSNLSLNSSKEDLRTTPVMRPSAKPKEERKWVMDSISKYFDVIVEEEDEEEEYSEDEEGSDNDYGDENDDDYDDDDDDVEDVKVPAEEQPGYKSSNRMRTMLGSVMSKLSSSSTNLNQSNMVTSLKRNLGSQISLRTSTQDLSLL